MRICTVGDFKKITENLPDDMKVISVDSNFELKGAYTERGFGVSELKAFLNDFPEDAEIKNIEFVINSDYDLIKVFKDAKSVEVGVCRMEKMSELFVDAFDNTRYRKDVYKECGDKENVAEEEVLCLFKKVNELFRVVVKKTSDSKTIVLENLDFSGMLGCYAEYHKNAHLLKIYSRKDSGFWEIHTIHEKGQIVQYKDDRKKDEVNNNARHDKNNISTEELFKGLLSKTNPFGDENPMRTLLDIFNREDLSKPKLSVLKGGKSKQNGKNNFLTE